MKAFEPPSDDRPPTLGPHDIDDIGPVRPHFTATIASFVLMIAGLTSAVAALQVYWAVSIYAWTWILPPTFGVLGLIAIPLGGMIGRASFQAAVAGTVVAGLMVAIEGGWTLWAIMAGFLAPLQVIAFLVSLLALLIVPFSIKTNRDVEAARAKLLA